MKQVPFWVDDYPRPTGITSQLPDRTDYLIVGSGLTGLSAALRLSEAGKEVTVVDAGPIAGGASSINGGMVSADVKAGARFVHAKHGPDIGREMWNSTVESLRRVEEIARRADNGAVVHRGGMLAVGRGPRQARGFKEEVEWFQAELGVHRRVLAGHEVHQAIGSKAFDVAVYEPDAFGVHPARLTFGLASIAAGAGTRLVDGCAVTSVSKGHSAITVTTTAGRLKAGTVIAATNGYTSVKQFPLLARRVVPIGSYIVVTEPLSDQAAQSVFPSDAMAYTRKRLLNYMRKTHDSRILMGGRRNLHTDLDLEESAEDLRSKITKLWPELADVTITHVWGGRLGVPFDLIPHIGEVDGIWYAMGYAGHGVGLAAQLGHELAGMLLGHDPPSVYSRIPHRGRIYYRGQPWFLTPASVLYRILDRFSF